MVDQVKPKYAHILKLHCIYFQRIVLSLNDIECSNIYSSCDAMREDN